MDTTTLSQFISVVFEDFMVERNRLYGKDLHLTELLYCTHKTLFRRSYEVFEEKSTLAMFRGIAWEAKFKDLLLNHVSSATLVQFGIESISCWYNAFTVAFVIDYDIRPVVMSPDVVINTERGKFVVEVKTTKSLYNKTYYEHHKRQTEAYILYSGAYAGCILYYDIRADAILLHKIKREDIDASFLHRYLKDAIVLLDNPPALPTPRYSWECGFCPNAACVNKTVVEAK